MIERHRGVFISSISNLDAWSEHQYLGENKNADSGLHNLLTTRGFRVPLRSHLVPHALQRMGWEGGPLRHCGDTRGLSQSGLVQGPEMVARSEPPDLDPVDVLLTRFAADPAGLALRSDRVVSRHNTSSGDAERLLPTAAPRSAAECVPAGSSASQTRKSRCKPFWVGEAGVSKGFQRGTCVLTGGEGLNNARNGFGEREKDPPAAERSADGRRTGEPCTD